MTRTSGALGGISRRNLARMGVRSARRLPHVVTAIGDSRIAALYNDNANGFARGGGSALNWANALLGQRLVIGQTFGTSGDRTDQMLARIDAATATRAGLLYLMGGANDIGISYPTLATSGATAFANLKTMIDKAITAGMQVVLELELGGHGYPTARVAQVRELNARLIEYAEATPDLFVHDARGAMWDGGASDSEIRMRAGLTYDGLHPNARGGYRWGKSLAQLIDRIVPPRPVPLLRSGADLFDLANRRQLLDNPVFQVGAGGTLANGATGTVPQYWIVRAQGGTTTVSVAAAGDGLGNEVTLACTFDAQGDYGRLQQSLDGAADPVIGSGNRLQRWQAGDVVEAFAQVRLNGVPTNLAAIYLQLQVNTGMARDCYDLVSPAGTGQLGPDEPCLLTLKTRPFVIPTIAFKNWLSAYLVIMGAGAGSANVTVTQMGVRRRETPY
ncbi:hypothetical protein COC42_16575 [Sphingomonas spermidinifaciens]|uniref:SGNH hydrolase-type esterase domain-containing protein n=1 Tax=Sphingomonas spermidinifaciens TaxID=1141889 RepID=A0A2A4B271_9SPHN|nr:GDSL-type esterase/lipase family protein [Sphingomonas spermidinifaciens]PCD01726.1 hypothetical protein COC42_16575 [Sphingomonas spermidinifaciens]